MVVNEYNNTYHSDYALTEKIEQSQKAPKFRLDDRVRITNYKNIFSKGCTN